MVKTVIVAFLCTALCAIGPPALAAVHVDPGRGVPVVVKKATDLGSAGTARSDMIAPSASHQILGSAEPSMLGDRPADGSAPTHAFVLNADASAMTTSTAAATTDSS